MLLFGEIFGKQRSIRIYFLGFLSGLALWINQDFAIAAAGVVSLYALFELKQRTKLNYFISMIFGALFYPTVLMTLGFDFRWDSIGFFAIQYTGGFMAEPIQTPGPVLIILPLIVALFFATTYSIYQERFHKNIIPAELRRAVLTSNFFSLWCLIGFAYYLNRSYASGQMQILFLPLSVSLASYLYYLVEKNREHLPWTPKTFFKLSNWQGSNLTTRLNFIPISLIMALPLATIIAFPNPRIEISRLTEAPEANRWPNRPLIEAERLALKLRTSAPDLFNSIGYLGNSGNFFELNNSVDSVNILNSPWDLPVSANPLELGCKFLMEKNYSHLILDDTGYAFAKLFTSGKLCDMYSPNLTVGDYEKLWSK
jgi:hypothetical protein